MKDIKSSKFGVADFPDSPEKGCHDVGFSDTIYIERADFKEKSTGDSPWTKRSGSSTLEWSSKPPKSLAPMKLTWR